LSDLENTTYAPPWYRDTTTKSSGPSKLTTARAISAPYSSWSLRIDSGDPSNPERFARITAGRLPLAAFSARATFFEESGNSVPPFQDDGPSGGWVPSRGTLRLSMPITQTEWPPRCAAQTMAVS